MIDHNATVLRPEQLSRHVARLNKGDKFSIDVQWEVAILYGLSRIGHVDHEPELPGTTKIDALLRPHGAPDIAIACDITAVSSAMGTANQVQRFFEDIERQIKKHGLDPRHFSYEPQHDMEGPPGDARLRLAIPTIDQMNRGYVRQKLTPFLDNIKQTPSATAKLVVNDKPICFVMDYHPNSILGGCSLPYIDDAYSLERNSIYKTLNDKADQIKRSGHSGPAGILLCDGGCRLLRWSHRSSGRYATYTAGEIIFHFLRKHSYVGFVATAYVETLGATARKRGRRHRLEIFKNPSATGAAAVADEILLELEKLPNVLPTPISDGLNIPNFQRFKPRGINAPLHDNLTIRQDGQRLIVEISARVLLEYLAGEISRDRFLKLTCMTDAKQINGRDVPNQFRYMLQNGRLIKSASLITRTEHDDDVIVFEFGDADVAVSPFREPSREGDAPDM